MTVKDALLTLLSAVSMPLVIPSSATPVSLTRADCPIPNWRVNAINVTYSNDTYVPGSASFVLSNSLTDETESLT